MVKVFFMTILIAMVPIIELRGAIPFAVAAGLPLWAAMIAAVIGNMIPVPFIILFIRRIFAWLRIRSKRLDKLVTWFEKKAEKNSRLVYKYELLGLMLLVAVPLPGTGAWTGALVASLLDIRLKTAVPVIFAGVVIAGVIVCALSHGFKLLFQRLTVKLLQSDRQKPFCFIATVCTVDFDTPNFAAAALTVAFCSTIYIPISRARSSILSLKKPLPGYIPVRLYDTCIKNMFRLKNDATVMTPCSSACL